MHDRLREDILGLKGEMIRLRRDFHRHPELAFREERTARVVAEYLRGLDMEVTSGVGRTGVIGVLSGKGPGKTILLRADMDALPVHEENDLEYRSEDKGTMHACGHDGHMAILLGAARTLKSHRQDFPGKIKFVFQPGEEGFAGAKLQIEEGALGNPRVHAALALHLMTHIPCGMVGVRTGPVMASMDSFQVLIKGKGGHAAMPEGGVDAVLMSAHAVLALQSMVSREVSPLIPLVVHVGTIAGGEAFNIIAESVEMHGTVRTLDPALRKEIPERMRRILDGVAKGFRGDFELKYNFGYPVVKNDGPMADLVKRAAGLVVGEEKVFEPPAAMVSDDMAFFLQEVPGCYFHIGAGNPQRGADRPHHNSRFNIDEDALPIGAEIMVRSALEYLNGKE